MSIYVELTDAFNRGQLRAVLSSGQAVVFHQLAVMSKDGDWILREDREALEYVLGELARRLESPRDQLQFSRSARDLVLLAKQHPGLVDELTAERPLLRTIAQGVEALESALDAERRRLMHANEARLQTYLDAVTPWRNAWLEVEAETAGLPLDAAHQHIVRRAETLLPFIPSGETAP